MRSRSSLSLGLLLILALSTAPVFAGEPTGDEFRISNPTPYLVAEPVVAFSPDGRSLVVWNNRFEGLRGRFFKAGAGAVSEDFTLVANGSFPPYPGSGEFVSRQHPSLLFHPSGDFFLFWTEDRSFLRIEPFFSETDILEQDVLGQRFDPDGVPMGSPFRVNTTTSGFQSRPQAVLVDPQTLLVVWEGQDENQGFGVFAQALDTFGTPMGDEFRVNQGFLPEAPTPSLAVDSRRHVLIAWTGSDRDGVGVLARLFRPFARYPVESESHRFSPLVPGGDEFQVNSTVEYGQRTPVVAASRGGQFLVIWQNELAPFDEYRIFGRFVTREQRVRGRDFQISTDIGTSDGQPALVASPSGTFLALWMVWDEFFPALIVGTELSMTGKALSEIFRVSLGPVNYNRKPGLAVDAVGDFMATWAGFLDRRSKLTIEGRQINRRTQAAPYQSLATP